MKTKPYQIPWDPSAFIGFSQNSNELQLIKIGFDAALNILYDKMCKGEIDLTPLHPDT